MEEKRSGFHRIEYICLRISAVRFWLDALLSYFEIHLKIFVPVPFSSTFVSKNECLSYKHRYPKKNKNYAIILDYFPLKRSAENFSEDSCYVYH